MERNLTELSKWNKWYEDRRREANDGLRRLGFSLYMEVKFYPEEVLEKSNKDLLNAAQQSIIRTFGWPIAVFLDTKPPEPQQYGIKTEISIKDSEDIKDKRYDYWAAKRDGSFYLLKSLFEDARKPGYLFFDTRIIRTTEVLMYTLNFYSKLGLNEKERITVKIKYGGLKGLTMAAAGNRLIWGNYKNNNLDEIETPEDGINLTLREIDERMSDCVKRLVDPLFEVFDWFEIEKKVIDEIVSNYRVGRIT